MKSKKCGNCKALRNMDGDTCSLGRDTLVNEEGKREPAHTLACTLKSLTWDEYRLNQRR